MLDVDEERAMVGRAGDTGDLLTAWADQKATDGAGSRVGCQHLVVAESLAFAELHVAVEVGLDPKQAVAVEPQAVRAAETVVRTKGRAVSAGQDATALIRVGRGRIHLTRPGQHEDLPGKPQGSGVSVALPPANDVTIAIVRTGVGGIHRVLRRTASAVVGEAEIDLAAVRMDGTPLGAIH